MRSLLDWDQVWSFILLGQINKSTNRSLTNVNYLIFKVFLEYNIRFRWDHNHASDPTESLSHCFYVITFTGKNKVSNGNSNTLLLPVRVLQTKRT